MKIYRYKDLPNNLRSKIRRKLLSRVSEYVYLIGACGSVTAWIKFLKDNDVYDDEIESDLFVLTMS